MGGGCLAKKRDWSLEIGKKFDRWTVLSIDESDKSRHTKYICKCSCDKQTIRSLYASCVLNGSTKSCGCYQKEVVSKCNSKHGKSNDKIYTMWMNMKQRCSNKNRRDYEFYGGRGISVCEGWSESFISFYNWAIENNYMEDLEIDRIDYNGDYAPDNCEFVTQEKNKEVGKKRTSVKTTTGFSGVYFFKESGKYLSNISYKGKRYHLGLFVDFEDACKARIDKEIEIFGRQMTFMEDGYEK